MHDGRDFGARRVASLVHNKLRDIVPKNFIYKVEVIKKNNNNDGMMLAITTKQGMDLFNSGYTSGMK